MITTLSKVDAGHLAAARVAVARATVQEAIAELNADYNELECRRARRAARKAGRGIQASCPACLKFVSNPARECPHCGFWGARGYAA